MGPSQSSNRQLAFDVEPLESRKLLAGNVQVAFNGENLTITGDDQDNNIEIETTSDHDAVIIGQLGTQITFNGVTASQQIIELEEDQSIGRLRVNMGGGNDYAEFEELFAERGIINMGDGNDDFDADFGSFGRLNYRGGRGIDHFDGINMTVEHDAQIRAERVQLLGNNLNGKLGLRGSDGDDYVEILDNTFVGAGTRIITGAGKDTIRVTDSHLDQSVQLRAGAGNDFWSFEDVAVGAMSVFGDAGSDEGVLFDVTALDKVEIRGNTISITGGEYSGNFRSRLESDSGANLISISDSSILGTTSIVSGATDDGVHLFENAFAGDVAIATGGGSDYVEAESQDSRGDFSVNLGAGADTFKFAFGGEFYGQVRLNGASGNDSLTCVGDAPMFFGGEPNYFSFETTPALKPI